MEWIAHLCSAVLTGRLSGGSRKKRSFYIELDLVMGHRGDAVVFLLTSTRKTTTLWSWTSHASWEERAGEPRHTFPLSLLIWHEHLNSFKNVLHPVFQSQCGCISARMSNWSASLIFFSAHPVGPIANNQVISPLIKWCTEDLSFRLLWGGGSAHLDPQFLSSPLMRYWRLLSATISAPLLSPCHCACFFFLWPIFWVPPASLRKSSADARWPSDLCLASDA